MDALLAEDIPKDHRWIPEGKSGWQFKAVSSFSTTQAANEVLDDKKTNLKPRIRKLLDENSTYVLIIGGKDYVPTDLEAREEAIRKTFKDMGYSNAKVKVLSSGQIADWASSLPSVVAYLKQDVDGFKDISEWQQSIGSQPFVADKERTATIDNLRDLIQNSQTANRATIIRLVGLSGVGKTRLAYECLNVSYLKEVVLYLESPDKLPHSRLTTISRNITARVILVIDECSHEKFVELAREAEPIGGRFTLMTLDLDIDKPRDAKDIHKILNPLDKISSEELIKVTSPGLPENARKKIIEFSEGYPKILTMLGENFGSHPDILSADTLNEIGVNEVLDRIIIGRSMSTFPTSAVRKVLTALSLFKRIGWDDDLAVQGKKVCDICNINWADAREIVADQENRKLIARAGRYRYVTPLPLAINLSSTWLRAMDTKSIRDFFNQLGNQEMQQAFQERLADLGYTAFAQQVLHSFLSTFDYETLNTSYGSEIFLNLSKADHTYSMAILNRIFSNRSKQELLKFEAGRRNIVWALQKIAWWKDTFADSALLLLRFADAENEEWSNNATGSFIDLFQTYLGGTEVPVWERFSVLEKILSEGDVNTKKIALKALGASLRLTHAIRSGGAEEQGVVIPPSEWNPHTVGDLRKAVFAVLALIDKAIQLPENDLKILAARLILNNSRELVHVGFSKELLSRLSLIQNTFSELENEVISNVETIIYFDGKQLPSEMLNSFREFRDNLVNSSYHSLMVRYVKANVFEDYLDDQEKVLRAKIHELASIAILSPAKLEKELPWLMTEQVGQVYLFGRALGELDTENNWLARIETEFKNNLPNVSLMFFSGYLSALKKRRFDLYQNTLINFSNIEKIPDRSILEIIWRSGSSDWDAQFIINLLRDRKVDPNEIRLLTYGAWFKDVKQEIFVAFIKEFDKLSDENSASAILGVIEQFAANNGTILNEREVILSVMIKSYRHKDVMDAHYWNKLMKVMTENFPDVMPVFVELALKRLSSESLVLGEELKQYIHLALKKDQLGTWLKIKEVLNSRTIAAWRVMNFIRGEINFGNEKNASIFSLLPKEGLWQWVNENSDTAPYLLARMIPLKETEPQLHPMARELILKYKEIPEIRHEILGNWYTEGYTGKESEHLKYKLSVIETWAKDSDNVISSWAKDEALHIRERIEQMEIKEAERDF